MGEYQANDMMELCCSAPTAIVQEAFAKAYGKIHGFKTDKGDVEPLYERIMVSVSGGSDSDVMIDFIERIGYPKGNLIYVFFDTGIEFAATKRHLDFLEEKYGVKIQRERERLFLLLSAFVNTESPFYLSKSASSLVAYRVMVSSGKTGRSMNYTQNIRNVKQRFDGGAMRLVRIAV